MLIVNPATGETIRDVTEDTAESVQRKFESLKCAQREWAATSLAARIKILARFSVLLDANCDTLAADLTAEMGKPLPQARNEIAGARARIAWITENAEKFLSDEIMSERTRMIEKIVYEPLGVVCNISAWNYPYLVGVNVFVPALIAGNTVMYKPSEYATITGMSIARLLKEAGVPEDAFHIAIGGKATGELLLDLPFDGYFFTGSYQTGKYIYERVAPRMVPCQCELGGKDPLYVCDDVADIKSVASATADGAFYNNGQSCCAVERIYVHEKIYDAYVTAFLDEVRSWKVGSPLDAGVYIGPLARDAQRGVLEAQIKDALEKGAVVACGGSRIEDRGYYFHPTVLLNVTHGMRVMREESFGPVIGIMKVQDDDEALRLMQDTEYGLTASVYSGDEGRAYRILSAIDTGSGYWNCCDRVSAAVPWSGRRHSGIGVTLSHAGLRAFARPKAYHLKRL